MEKKNTDNKVHIHGFINNVESFDAPSGDTVFRLNVATKESWKANESDKEYQEKVTHHNVSINTKDEKFIAKMNDIAADIEAKKANADDKDFKPVNHEASFDGKLVTRTPVYNEVTYNKQYIVCTEKGVKLDCKLEEKETRNSAEITGNISKIDMKDNFAIINIATHYFAPGKGVDYKGNEKEYHEETNFIETRISENFRKDTFAKLKNGEIETGDLVTVRGQMHNNSYTDKNDVRRSKIVIDLRSIDIVAKKKKNMAEEQKEEKKEVKKEVKKATNKKKTQRSM